VIWHSPILSAAAVSKCGEGSGYSHPQGGLNPWGLGASNRPASHAQIFFLSAKLLIIFSEIKQSNGGALSPDRRCESLQALTCSVLGGGCVLDGYPRICFRSRFGQTRGAVKSSARSRSRTAWLIRSRNLEIRYRKPTTRRLRSPGGLNLWRLRPETARQAGTHFREIRKLFLFALKHPGLGPGSKMSRNSGWGGSVAVHEDEVDA
jgi:hypothetical protein